MLTVIWMTGLRQALLAAGLTVVTASSVAQSASLSPTEAIWRATSRLGYAPTAASVAAISQQAGGAQAWALAEIDRAYAASQIPPVIPAQLANFGQLASPAEDPKKRARQLLRQQVQQASAWRLASCSNARIENPLLARLTEFWFNHLNVSATKPRVRAHIAAYDLTVIRPRVLGRFDDLLLASARHPAMLFYLDQANSNTKRGLNENYARELMELHTLGVGGGYSQTDVRELARILTGWSLDPAASDGFAFLPQRHDPGQKTFLGKVVAPQGEAEGRAAIAQLAHHPATARRLAHRLAQFFITDQPSAALVARLAKTFTDSNGDLRQTLRAVVMAPEFWQPNHQLFKTPYDYACSSLAVLQPEASKELNLAAIGASLQFLRNAGQTPLAWPTPDGYSTDAATWMVPEALSRRADS